MIRPIADGDVAELLDVWERAARIAHSFLPEDFFAAERREIEHRWLPAAETSVYELEDRVVGFVSMLENEVGGLFVDPALQRRGIGRALLDSVWGSFPSLELSVLEGNAIGRGFYDRYGFEIVGRGIDPGTGFPELRLRAERTGIEDDDRDGSSD